MSDCPTGPTNFDSTVDTEAETLKVMLNLAYLPFRTINWHIFKSCYDTNTINIPELYCRDLVT